MRTTLLACALLAMSCDPVNKITVRFPLAAPANVSVHWVHQYDGRTYAQGRVFRGEVSAPELVVTRSECCGTAAAYRSDKLWFIACVEQPGADPRLVCGRPGEAKVTTSVRAGTTCDALDREISRADIALATCTLTTPAAGAGSN